MGKNRISSIFIVMISSLISYLNARTQATISCLSNIVCRSGIRCYNMICVTETMQGRFAFSLHTSFVFFIILMMCEDHVGGANAALRVCEEETRIVLTAHKLFLERCNALMFTLQMLRKVSKS